MIQFTFEDREPAEPSTEDHLLGAHSQRVVTLGLHHELLEGQ